MEGLKYLIRNIYRGYFKNFPKCLSRIAFKIVSTNSSFHSFSSNYLSRSSHFYKTPSEKIPPSIFVVKILLMYFQELFQVLLKKFLRRFLVSSPAIYQG